MDNPLGTSMDVLSHEVSGVEEVHNLINTPSFEEKSLELSTHSADRLSLASSLDTQYIMKHFLSP